MQLFDKKMVALAQVALLIYAQENAYYYGKT